MIGHLSSELLPFPFSLKNRWRRRLRWNGQRRTTLEGTKVSSIRRLNSETPTASLNLLPQAIGQWAVVIGSGQIIANGRHHRMFFAPRSETVRP